ncbi:IS30 family transposase [Georgenia muralis]|uniref:IS30 family transposase n=1 Tax=Georgenia muralis TaxID=154117 RepID=A0A3N4ZAH5_9MICO|nr:IS30 family transposase [Georgenia muralis]
MGCRPPVRREVQREFWRLVAGGVSTAAAGEAVGASLTLAHRWFRDAGGMAPMSLADPTGRYLSFEEREVISLEHAGGVSARGIGLLLGRSPSTITRELARNVGARQTGYRASRAHAKAAERARRPKPSKVETNEALRAYVQAKLAEDFSPEQISHRLRVDFPEDESMRIGHEAVYRSLYLQTHGALTRELTKHLRTGRYLRQPRKRLDGRTNRSFITEDIHISARPPEAADRAVPGHWEGDLIVGHDNGSAIGTLVERTTGFTMLLHLPVNHAAPTVASALAAKIQTLPKALRASLTWDQGIEMSKHELVTAETGLQIYFCDPHSPWQRGTNENTNGLLRQYFPKGGDLSVFPPDYLDYIAAKLNARPRKRLQWRTPAEAMDKFLTEAT